MNKPSKAGPNIVTIGGGTGSFTLLQAFKQYFAHITAIVNMADDGGSTGMLRDELGVLPPGDIRQCLVALSDAPELRELFSYRFSEGSLSGQSFGNLFLSASEKVGGDFEAAVKLASKVLRIHGSVLPVTTEDAELVLAWPDGTVVAGEFEIGHLHFEGQSKPAISLKPNAAITEAAQKAIEAADYVVIAPGNLYGSLAPALVVKGMREALETTKAKIIYVANLVTKPGQTDGFMVHDYADEIERFIGTPVLDYVFYNTYIPPADMLHEYVKAGELLVPVNDEKLQSAPYEAIGLPLIAHDVLSPRAGDTIGHTRSFIRHDGHVVAQQILELF